MLSTFHARIEQGNADLNDNALAHLPSGEFATESTWLVAAVIAYNFTRTAVILAQGPFRKTRTSTIRGKIISIRARIASIARLQQFHLPQDWPRQTKWVNLFTVTDSSPQAV
jgi:hypothetical protein